MKETGKKICPLLALVASSKIEFLPYCIGEECAWWCKGISGKSGMCAISMTGESIYSIDRQGLEVFHD